MVPLRPRQTGEGLRVRLKAIHLKGFKRFTDTHIQGLPASANLIIIAGPNGVGKSSLFDGLKNWHWAQGGPGVNYDETYARKVGTPASDWNSRVSVEFHEPVPASGQERNKLIYLRSAFRHEADFNMSELKRVGSPINTPKVKRMIDPDRSVSDNFQRLVMSTIRGLFGSEIPGSTTIDELRDQLIGQIRHAMQQVFPDLVLDGVGSVLSDDANSIGTFYFSKGSSAAFLYKNLSAGEKAAFDLILDGVVKAQFFDNSIWCIDEPEGHLNTRVQASLLRTLVGLLPPQSQMVLASHGIGFMREAWEMATEHPGAVAFLDFGGRDFDQPQIVVPTQPSRAFWASTLDVALGDMARLIAPEHIVLCEGRPKTAGLDHRAEFDASCYRIIFAAEFPNTDFLSVGNSDDVSNDRLGAGQAIQAVNAGTRITRLIDRDLMNEDEIRDKLKAGIHVLSRRNIEAFLLSDETLTALCEAENQPDKSASLIVARDTAIADSVSRGNDQDDLKKVSATVAFEARKLLSMQNPGSDWIAFARAKLCPLLKPGMQTYDQLRADIFGDC